MIRVENLSRHYGHSRGVFELSFAVKEGETFGFLGPNGAGKTTTIRHLMGFLKPQSGKCTILGLDCWQSAPEIQKSLGYIPGEMSFFDDMTGESFLRFLSDYRGTHNPAMYKKLIERFELDASGKLKKMSKGTRQKVSIIAAFMHDPAVLILDEPTSGLDPLMQARFIDLMLEEKARGKTILISSHQFEEVERTCHRVAILRSGRLATIESVEGLKAVQQKKLIVTLGNAQAAQAFAKEPLVQGIADENHVTVTVRNNLNDLIAVLHRYPLTNLSTPHQSLEEVFMQYYGGADHA